MNDKKTYNRGIIAYLFWFLILLTSCTSISQFSQDAYNQAVTLKVESLTLMDYAVEEYSTQADNVEHLKKELKKAYEFARGRPDNEISAKQWEILIDENRSLLGGFLKRWKDEGTLSATFVIEAQLLVNDAFDTIIGLESGKVKLSEIQ
jgi:hypothetical protein